jgi:glucose-1-phosphatase
VKNVRPEKQGGDSKVEEEEPDELDKREIQAKTDKASADKAKTDKANADKAKTDKANADKANADKANAAKANADKIKKIAK